MQAPWRMGRTGFEPVNLGLIGGPSYLGLSRSSWKTRDFGPISIVRSRWISVELVARLLPPKSLGARTRTSRRKVLSSESGGMSRHVREHGGVRCVTKTLMRIKLAPALERQNLRSVAGATLLRQRAAGARRQLRVLAHSIHDDPHRLDRQRRRGQNDVVQALRGHDEDRVARNTS